MTKRVVADDPAGAGAGPGAGPAAPAPAPAAAREWLETMSLIRRFEERAGEQYARGRVGGFLHLAIGEEAAIVGAARALEDRDYLISTYRSHGHALARGTEPERVMAELFGREGGVSRGRGGSMHLFDGARRFMGGYGIVGANLPIAAGIALASDQLGRDEVTLCVFGDGAVNQGNFGETLNLAALWRLPVVFLVSNNQFGMGTAVERHSAVTDLCRRGEALGVPGTRCDGMDVAETHSAVSTAVRRAREEREPTLVEALTYRFRGHSVADPEQYRTSEQVDAWRERDPLVTFAARLVETGTLGADEPETIDRAAAERIEAAVAFAESSPEPSPDSLYDDVYVLGDQVRGWWSVDARSAAVHRGEDNRSHPDVAADAPGRDTSPPAPGAPAPTRPGPSDDWAPG